MSALPRKRPRTRKVAQEFEATDVSARLVLLVTIGLFAGMGLSILIVFGILGLITPGTQTSPAIFGSQQERSGPRLEVSPAADREELQRQMQRQLQAYGWIDHSTQTAHIPIDRAMAILALRGWPDADKQEGGR